jgi:VanZ family protein
LLLGSFLEILQIWIPNRSFEFLDMLANTSGVVIGLVIIQIFNKIKVIKK